MNRTYLKLPSIGVWKSLCGKLFFATCVWYNKIDKDNKRLKERGEMKKGFTLIEITIAIAILTLVIGGILYSYVISLNTIRNLEYKTKALLFAQEILEEFRGQTLVQLVNNYDGVDFPYEDINVHTDIEVLEGSLSLPLLLRITFEISWPTNTNPLTLVSYITQR